MSGITKIYTAVKTVLTGYTPLTAKVPVNNIRPSEDPSEPAVGNMLYYSISGFQWDTKRLRGQGVLNVSVAATGNNIRAGEIMDIVRDVLTARVLSYDGGPLTFHLCKEQESYTDAGTTDSDRWLAATSFDLKVTEAA